MKFGWVLILLLLANAPSAQAVSIVESYPNLKELTFKEPKSNFYLGFGFTPIGSTHGRTLFGINFFQLHWIRDYWDMELFSATYGMTNGQPAYLESRHFLFRTSPKIRFFKMLSVGPLLGYEYVSFPEINSHLFKVPWATPVEPFSSKGLIYGLMFSETLPVWNDYILKLNQVIMKQTYSTEKTTDNWDYLFDRREVRNDKSAIEADTVLMIEISLLF